VALAAVWGAALSTTNWLDRRAERARRLDVKLYFGALIAEAAPQPAGLLVEARNPGYQKVRVITAGVILPDGSDYYITGLEGPAKLPRDIDPTDHHVVLLAGHNLTNLCEELSRRGFAGTVDLVGFFHLCIIINEQEISLF